MDMRSPESLCGDGRCPSSALTTLLIGLTWPRPPKKPLDGAALSLGGCRDPSRLASATASIACRSQHAILITIPQTQLHGCRCTPNPPTCPTTLSIAGAPAAVLLPCQH